MTAFERLGAFFVAALLGAAPLAAEEISVLVSGKYHDPVDSYKIGSSHYLNARQAGALYGGQVYWYPVSGRVQMSFRGRGVQFVVDSDAARLGERIVKLESPVMLRSSQAYAPLSFFLSEEFSDWVGLETTFNPRTKLLTVDRRSSVGPARWFSYKEHTRLVLELDARMGYSASARGVGGLEVSFPLGILDASEQAEIGDGVVEVYSLLQEPKAAKLSIRFAREGLRWRVKELSDPRRLAVDVYPGRGRYAAKPLDSESGAEAEPAGEPGAPEPVPSAAPQASTEAPKSAGPATLLSRDGRARRRIVIDAGHGGKDSGARGRRGTEEKDINLLAAQELAKLLREEEAFEVLLTRQDDAFVPLADRSRLANEFGADLFVSLHCNASRKARDSGFEVYFLSERASDPEAERLAEFENSALALEGKSVEDEQAAFLLQELTKTENINAASEFAALLVRAMERRVDIENRGVKQAAFYVLRGTHAPAVLFELAFLSNRKDEAKLESRKFRRRMIDGLYAGIIEYAKRQGWMAAPRDKS